MYYIFKINVKTCFAYLNSGFWQVDFESHLLSHEDVWVACFLEEGLQNVQLGTGEGCALPPLLPRVVGLGEIHVYVNSAD